MDNQMTTEVLQFIASLEANYDNHATDETEVFFYKGSPEHWSLTYGQLRKIWAERNFSVTSKSDKTDRGLFQIGPMKRWYYSHSLFQEPELLKKKIAEMIVFSLIGNIDEDNS